MDFDQVGDSIKKASPGLALLVLAVSAVGGYYTHSARQDELERRVSVLEANSVTRESLADVKESLDRIEKKVDRMLLDNQRK